MILYFSGTGNSRYLAEVIQKNTKDNLISMNEKIKSDTIETLHSDKPLVFVVPTYAWQMPRIVCEYILNTTFTGNNKAYFILTCGMDSGNAAHFARELCNEKNFRFMGLRTIVMPENYIALFKAPPRNKIPEIISAAVPKAAGTAKYILNEQKFPTEKHSFLDKIKSSVINDLFYEFSVSAKKFHVTSKCTGCGKCERLCVLNNITITDNKPVWGSNCTHCMACINACPTKAIEYGQSTKYKKRYYCSRTVK